MKFLRYLSGGLLLAALALLLVNCEQKSSTGPSSTTPTSIIGNVSLTAVSLQLYSIPGTPASTNITATVTDTAGTAVPNILVRFTTPAVGSISSTSDSTDADGKVTVTFNSQGQYGTAVITASVTSGGDTKTGTISIGVFPLTGLAHDITLSLSPSLLYLASGVDDSIMATVRVFDSLGVGIPAVHVTLGTTMGVVTIADSTDASGTTVTYVHTNEEYGMGLVTASVNTSLPDTSGPPDSTEGYDPPVGPGTWPGVKTGEVLIKGLGIPKGSISPEPPGTDDIYTIADVDTFWVFPIDQQISDLIISSYPTSLSVAPDTIGSALITASIFDSDNNGVEGVPVSFATNLGLLTASSGMTDSTGRKSVIYTSLANQYGLAKIWAVVGELSDTCEIIIAPTASANGSLLIFTDTQLIYADYGITFANITALLKDSDNQVISGVPIIFTADYGTINSPVLTDSTGQAHAIFQDIGFPTYPDSATVIAKYNPLAIADTVRIMIEPERIVDHIVLNTGSNSLLANGVDSTRLDATVYLENNALAPSGTLVNFILGGAASGRFSAPQVQVASAGMATVYYYAGVETGLDSLFAMVDQIYSNAVLMQLISGPPSGIDITVDPTTLPVNSLQMATVTAEVTDTTGNLVGDGEGVFFTTSLGSISPPEAPTLGGVATSYLSASTTAGSAWVKASVAGRTDSTLVTFVPSVPAFISLSADTSAITVAGAGGGNQTGVEALVKDAASNPVGNGIMVHFEIIGGAGMGGINLNDHGLEDSTTTSGGVARVVLNSGTVSGPVQIRAWTVLEGGTEISTQQSLVTVVAGPPDFIDINSMSLPETGDGDSWRVEVSTLVLDIYGNQVPNGVSVSFTLLPDTSAAQIQGAGTTGNQSWQGNSYPGVAYTTLTYNADETFDVVTIIAYCMVGEDSVIGSQEYQLPLANGDLSLAVVPIAWNFDHPPPGYTTTSPATMDCRAYLVDGHGTPINNAVIIFFSTAGDFFWYQNGTGPSYEKITGPAGFSGPPPEPPDSTGYACIWLLTTQAQAFPDPGAIQTTGQVHCQVAGYFDVTSDPITVTYTRDG